MSTRQFRDQRQHDAHGEDQHHVRQVEKRLHGGLLPARSTHSPRAVCVYTFASSAALQSLQHAFHDGIQDGHVVSVPAAPHRRDHGRRGCHEKPPRWWLSKAVSREADKV